MASGFALSARFVDKLWTVLPCCSPARHVKSLPPLSRRGAGAVERGGLEKRLHRSRMVPSHPGQSGFPRYRGTTRATIVPCNPVR